MSFEIACEKGNKELVEEMIKNEVNKDTLNLGLSGACRNNHKDIALLLIVNGANIDFAYYLTTKSYNRVFDFQDIEYLYKTGINDFGQTYGGYGEIIKRKTKNTAIILDEFVLPDITDIISKY